MLKICSKNATFVKNGFGAQSILLVEKGIKEASGRVLHIVVNSDVHPNRIVTVFFDRRLGKRRRGE